MSEERLIVFVKAPRPGTVKTRLGLGADAEAAAYQRLTQAVLAELGKFTDVELRFAPADAEEEIRHWLRSGWESAAQAEGDLGMRLNSAFADAFERGARRVVIIGSDCPYVRGEDIREAWAQLQTNDLVLGPAEDGGYWLIGLREMQPKLFSGIAWSSDQVFAQTTSRAKTLGLKTALLRILSDVDTREDWERFISAAAQAPPRPQAPSAD